MSVLGGTLDYDYSYTQFGGVGGYTIMPSGLTSDNYDISFATGTLTVEQKTVGLDWSNTSLTIKAVPEDCKVAITFCMAAISAVRLFLID